MIPELEPFAVDPLILKPLREAKFTPLQVTALGTVVAAIGVVWSSASAHLFWWTAGSGTVGDDLTLFVLRRPAHEVNPSMPYLRDYPSMVLTAMVVAAVCLVYALYHGAAVLHGDLERSRCVKGGDEVSRAELAAKVHRVNERLRSWGKFSPLALVAAIGFTLLTNLSLQSGLFGFLGSGLYDNWWASLYPLRPGGVVWVVFGGIGIYMVYAEAVLGLTYVNFLRRLREPQDYKFRANELNPDGFFGWRRLRQLITNMQAGAVCTLLSAWAFSFFLEPATGPIATIAVLGVFIGIVTYVYVSVNGNFRRQVRRDVEAKMAEVAQEIDEYDQQNLDRLDAQHLLRTLVAYRRLDLISKIPSTPIRQSWLLAGVVSLLGTVAGVVVPLVQYFM